MAGAGRFDQLIISPMPSESMLGGTSAFHLFPILQPGGRFLSRLFWQKNSRVNKTG